MIGHIRGKKLLRLFSIAYINALVNSFFLQHALERVKRPGESQEVLDGKKHSSLPYSLVVVLKLP